MSATPESSRTMFSRTAFALARLVPASTVPTPVVVGVDVPDYEYA